MHFYREHKSGQAGDGKRFAVYMRKDSWDHYVCDMMDDSTDEAKEINETGLTLRMRLGRSLGKYALLEGVVYNPNRLIMAAIDIQDVSTEKFEGGDLKKGYTLVTIVADNCINKYMIFSSDFLAELTFKIQKKNG